MSSNLPHTSSYIIRKGVRPSSRKDRDSKISSTNADSNTDQQPFEAFTRSLKKPRKTSLQIQEKEQNKIIQKTKTQFNNHSNSQAIDHVRQYLLYNSKIINEMINSGKVSADCIQNMLHDTIIWHQIQQQLKTVNPYEMPGMRKVQQTFCQKLNKQLQLKFAQQSCQNKRNQISDMIAKRLKKLQGIMKQ